MEKNSTNKIIVFSPVLLIIVAVIIAFSMVFSRPDLSPKPLEKKFPLVEVGIVELETIPLWLKSQGNVSARHRTALTSEVSGRVEWVSEKFFNGQAVKSEDMLLKIDPTDYQAALADSRANLRNAELNFEQEKIRAQQAAEDWLLVNQDMNLASDLTLRKPQLERARAQVNAARKKVKQAEQNLSRTKIRAPFSGIVDGKFVDLGQYVITGAPITTLLGTDIVEVRLPISAGEFDFLDPQGKAKVELSNRLGKRVQRWQGYISRVENQVDAKTRVYYAVAAVEDPYGLNSAQAEPLRLGLFVDASIAGITVPQAVRLPRIALVDQKTVYLVDDNNQLQLRQVNVMRTEPGYAIINQGLENGDRVLLTKLDLMTNGMEVKVANSLPLSTES